MIIPNIIIDIPLSLVQLLVVVFVAVPSVCVVATLEAHRFATAHHRKWLKGQKADIAKERKALNEEAANLRHARNDLRVREEAVVEAEHRLGHRTREVIAGLPTEGELFDTTELELEEISFPNDMEATVEIPVIEDELR